MKVNRKRLASLVCGGVLFYLFGSYLIIPVFLSNNPQHGHIEGQILGWLVTAIACIAAFLVGTLLIVSVGFILSWLREA